MGNKVKQMTFYQSELFKRLIEGNPLVLIDVGARGGIAQKWGPLKGVMKIIGFEPDENECQQLNETAENNQVYLPVALSNRKGKVKLNVTRNPACCSTFEPNYALVDRFLAAEELEVTGPIEVNCDTLDEVIKTTDVKGVDFIKLDAQGSELQILQGAEDVLSKYCVFGIEVEVEFSPIYKGQPLFTDLDGFLRDRGFTLFDITIPLGRKVRKTVPNDSKDWKGQGLWTDALYFRDLAAGESQCLEKLTREMAAKTIAVAEFHGFGDFALELLDTYLHKGIVDDSEHSAIRRMLLLPREGKFKPELKLFQDARRSMAEFLRDRFPSIHKFIVKNIVKRRGY